jgi:uncharacterized protein (UPF0276 family)
MNRARLGISVSVLELEKILTLGLPEALGRINHFSLGFQIGERGPFEKVGAMARDAQCSLSLHPVDLNLSDQLDPADLTCVIDVAKALDAKYIEEDLGIWRVSNLFMGSHLVNPLMTDSSIQQTIENLSHIQSISPVPILIENPPIYWNYGPFEFWEYFSKILMGSNTKMAFDIGHYIGYCRSLEKEIYMPMPQAEIWDRIQTIHISGALLWEWQGIAVWLDRHTDIISTYLLKVATHCLRCATNLHSVLLEMEGADQATQSKNIGNVMAILDSTKAA